VGLERELRQFVGDYGGRNWAAGKKAGGCADSTDARGDGTGEYREEGEKTDDRFNITLLDGLIETAAGSLLASHFTYSWI
jgi:hypothetical protein